MRLPRLFAASLARSAFSRCLPWSIVVCVAIGGLSVYSWAQQWAQTAEPTLVSPVDSGEPIQPITPLPSLNRQKIELGRKLFHDRSLSRGNQLSCATCHILAEGGADRKVRSIGIDGAEGVINAPTVLNSGFNFSQFWDGRASTLEVQVDEPIQSKTEMGSSWPEIMEKLERSREYAEAFRRIYGESMKREHVKNCIAEFERSLSTPNSRFDRYLQRDKNVLSSREQQGYQLFKSFGCASCHQGINMGGNMYQKVGVMAPYFADRGNVNKADLGRFNVTGEPRDMYMFKVPSLRNVALTAPYFHDGSAATLMDAVDMMAKYQLGHLLTNSETSLIVEFLRTLTGELEGQPL